MSFRARLREKGDSGYGFTCLGGGAWHLAVSRGYVCLVTLLLDLRAAPDEQDEDGDAALFVTIWKKRSGIRRILRKHGCSVDHHNHDNLTPLTDLVSKVTTIFHRI